MTTSSSDRSRCTRISPSAILDDRLAGKDLEWARDHLRRCESCRDRVEDFREMLLRVGRLPRATVTAAALDQAYATAIPERLRDSNGGSRYYETAPAGDAVTTPAAASFTELAPLADLPPLNNFDPAPQSVRPEVTSIPDMLTELEREIFRDEPVPDHPAPMTPMAPIADTNYPAMAEPEDKRFGTPNDDYVDRVSPPHPEMDELAAASAAPREAPAEPWREVPVDSHRDWAPATSFLRPSSPVDDAPPPSHYAVYDEPDLVAPGAEDDVLPPTPPRKPDTAMRLAVGLGAAACVILAAVLYEGGFVLRGGKLASTASTAVVTTTHASATARPSPSPSPTPVATPTPAPALFTFPNGVAGDDVFRIRLGTAVAGFTRLVFDMHGTGLPSATITAPDASHVVVTFQGTTATGLVVAGFHSYNVAGVEAPVQQGADVSITVDLARAARVTAFTLPQEPGYAWRLVVDLHTP